MNPYDRVVAALEGIGSRRNGGRGNWVCPAHDDREPSLSVTAGATSDGAPTVLIHCHAGCSTTQEILPKLGLEPADLFSTNITSVVQTSMFPAERFSPVRRSGWLAMPPGAVRDFGVATTFGRLLVADGTFRRVAATKETVGLVLNSRDRRSLMQVLGITSSHMRNLIATWIAMGMAHRCTARGAMCLFVKPEPTCPYCGARTSVGTDVQPEEASVGTDVQIRERHPARTFVGTNPHQPSSGSHKELDSDALDGVPGEHEQAQSDTYDATKDPAHPLHGYDSAKALEYLRQDTEAGRWPPWDRRSWNKGARS